MSALSHPADERRIREIVREELAALQASDAPLIPDDAAIVLDAVHGTKGGAE